MTQNTSRPSIATIIAPTEPPDVTVSVPGSKSITNRALLLAALADGPSVLDGLLWADDTRHMISCLGQMGVEIDAQEPNERVEIAGLGGHWRPSGEVLYIGNAGTAARFLTAACALSPHAFEIDGDPRMRERPIGPLLEALRSLGVDAVDKLGTGAPPLRIQGPIQPGTVTLDARSSSQYLSALLMTLPLAAGNSRIDLKGGMPTRPYVDMTLRMMASFGIQNIIEENGSFLVPGRQRYTPRQYRIEPDASSASYFFAAAAVTGGRVTVTGLSSDSLQGDTRFVEVLGQMGCTVEYHDEGITVTGPADGRLRGLSIDLNDMSDMTLTLAAIAPLADSPVKISNVAHIRLQESDRISAMATELSRLGIRVEEAPDGLTIYPGTPKPAQVHTYNDHRIAMAFAVLALRVPGLEIADPACVNKTFPDFFQRFTRLGARVTLHP